VPSFEKLWQWQTTKNAQKAEKGADVWRPAVHTGGAFLSAKGDGFTWLGHCTFLIRLGGVSFLTDPIFYGMPLVPRQIGLPCPPEALTGIDYILLSHNHRDHCDEKSMTLVLRQNPQARVLTGLGIARILRRWAPQAAVQEAGWYQSYDISAAHTGIGVSYLPSRHWARRNLRDLNDMLWGAFVLQTPAHTLYFSGDSAYDRHFTDVGRLFPEVDTCLMGVGAYAPRWYMQDNHMAPEEAIKGFHDINGRTFVPMHYGTYDLSDEPLGEPLRILRDLEAAQAIAGKLLVPAVGEWVPLSA